MQLSMLTPTIRTCSRAATATRLTAAPLRRSYATGEARGPMAKDPAAPTPAGQSRIPIFAIGGVVFALVAGRYILASDKPARSEQLKQQESRRRGETSNRDLRDTGVKTLEQKRQKEEGS